MLNFFDYFYQKKIIRFLKKKNVNKIDNLIDVGAHKGETIKLFLSNFIVKKIISFEASPQNFSILNKNLNFFKKKFKYTDISTENIGLGAQNKSVIFKQFSESSSSTISKINENSKYYKKKFKILNFFGHKKSFNEIKINIQRLEDYLKKKDIHSIDFLKIDTEGYEYEILIGLGKMINNTKFIMFEHHYDNMILKNYTFRDINNFLIKNNFLKIYKSKMPFRKTFEYIYTRDLRN